MINILIIEDEEPAAERLTKLIEQTMPAYNIVGTLDSVEASIEWFANNEQPDLLFLDIQLADGLSFDIFKQVKINSFVIFTTAYDEYAIKAFELNSIDYLLKPITETKLKKSIDKFTKLNNVNNTLNINDLISTIESKQSNYKKRFLINMGSKIKSVETTDIAYFYVLEKNTFLCTFANKHYPIDFSLDKLESLLNLETFYRINRQAMINFKSIEKISILSKSRIKLNTNPLFDSDFLVSSNKSHDFRQWLDR